MKAPETYTELMLQKRCYDLTRHYSLSNEDVMKVYNFLSENPKGKITGNKVGLTLSVGFKTIDTISAACTDSKIDGLTMTLALLTLIPHYVPH